MYNVEETIINLLFICQTVWTDRPSMYVCHWNGRGYEKGFYLYRNAFMNLEIG